MMLAEFDMCHVCVFTGVSFQTSLRRVFCAPFVQPMGEVLPLGAADNIGSEIAHGFG